MKTLIVYKEHSEQARAVETFMHDFAKQTGKMLETVDPETLAGIQLCETYDLVEYPSVLAIDDNGLVQNIWRGLPMPTISEVSYYA